MTDKTGQKCFGRSWIIYPWRKNNNIQRNYEFCRLVIHIPPSDFISKYRQLHVFLNILCVFFWIGKLCRHVEQEIVQRSNKGKRYIDT